MTRPLPVIDDHDTAEFFAAAAQGRLAVRCCRDCSNGIHPPTAHCPFCGSWNTAWRDASGQGTLYTWTTVHHQLHPDFPTPYTVVAVQLDDVPRVRLVGTLPGAPTLQAGMPMEVFFEAVEEGVTLPNWRPGPRLRGGDVWS